MPRVDDYKAAIALAAAELKKINPKRLVPRTGSEYFFDGEKEWLVVPYFGQGRRISWPEIVVTKENGEGEVSLTEQILILHYILRCTGEPLSGINIDFRQVPQGSFYWSAFVARAKKPLLETFGLDLDFYMEVARRLGGQPTEVGDAGARFLAFPLVPVIHALWRGDEEFPPDANILFDETISLHLSTEDIAALAGASVYRLMGAARQMRSGK